MSSMEGRKSHERKPDPAIEAQRHLIESWAEGVGIPPRHSDAASQWIKMYARRFREMMEQNPSLLSKLTSGEVTLGDVQKQIEAMPARSEEAGPSGNEMLH